MYVPFIKGISNEKRPLNFWYLRQNKTHSRMYTYVSATKRVAKENLVYPGGRRTKYILFLPLTTAP